MGNAFEAGRIGFRWLTEDDFALIHRWLNQGEALRWYGLEPTTPEEVANHYRPRLHGQSTTTSFLITYDGEPVGYIQRYLTSDEPEYWGHQNFPPGTAGIDLFIGEETFLHRGLGPAAIGRFLTEHVFAQSKVVACIIDPDPANTIAIRAYEEVGFCYLRNLMPPDHIDPTYLMMLTREEFDARNAPHPPTTPRAPNSRGKGSFGRAKGNRLRLTADG